MRDLEGRSVVVTGAAAGVGRGLACEAARRGAEVLAVDINEPAETVSMVEQAGGRATGAVCDITDLAALRSLAAQNPDIDLVCANVGEGARGTVKTITPDDFRRILEINVVGTFQTIQAFLPALADARAAKRPANIVITGSEHSLGAPPYVAPMTAYTTSKHALLGLAVCLARDLADDGIGVSLLCPSYVATERLRAMATESADVQAILRDYAQEPEQVARQAFDGMASRQLVVPTNGLSTAFVTELHTAIVNAMPQPLEDRP